MLERRNEGGIGALLCISVIILMIYFGVVETNRLLIFAIVLSLIFVLIAISLIFLGFHFYPQRQTLQKKFEKPLIQINRENQLEKIDIEQLTPLKESETSSSINKTSKNSKEFQDEWKKVDHFYISIY